LQSSGVGVLMEMTLQHVCQTSSLCGRLTLPRRPTREPRWGAAATAPQDEVVRREAPAIPRTEPGLPRA
jgi:hypothetical protein